VTLEGAASPERRRRPQLRAGAETRDNAFLNVPYDRRYERLYLAFIAGLSAFGLAPRATVELAGSQRRLERIIRLLRSCRYSFHDLSRVSLDRNPPATPRFTAPCPGLAKGAPTDPDGPIAPAPPMPSPLDTSDGSPVGSR